MANKKPRPRKRKPVDTIPPEYITKRKNVELTSFIDHLTLTDDELKKKYPSNEKNPGGAPTKYNTFYHPKAIYFLTKCYGAKVNQICDFIEIDPSTFYLWEVTYPKFSKAYRKGLDEWNNGNAENALIQKALGYNFKEERYERKVIRDNASNAILDEYGRKQYEFVCVSYTKKHQSADTKALSMWLMNRDRDRWKSVETRVNEFRGQIEHEHKHKHDHGITPNRDLSQLPEKTLKAILELEHIIDITPVDKEEE